MRLSVSATLAVLAIAGLCLFLSVQSPVHPSVSATQRNATSADLASQLGSLAEQIRTAEKGVLEAKQIVANLGTQRAKAEQADTALSEEAAQRSAEVPRLEAAIAACERSEKQAAQAYRECSVRLREFHSEKDPVSKLEKRYVALAKIVRSGEHLTPRQESEWGDIPKAIRNGVLRYLAVCDRLADEERSLATESARLTKERQSLSSRLSYARQRQTDVPNELSRNRALLPELEAASVKAEAGLASAQEHLASLTRQRQSLNLQLATIQAATPKPVAQRGPQTSEQAAKATNNSLRGYAYAPRASQAGGGLAALPRPVRSLILAEAAGIDTGVDLGLDEPPIAPPPRIYIYGAGAQSDANKGGSHIHRDGMGRTVTRGNQTLVQRLNGPSALYTRQGDWEAAQWSNGVHGYRYYDDFNGVQRFDYRNPWTGVRTIGEQPYPGNDVGQGWSRQMFGW